MSLVIAGLSSSILPARMGLSRGPSLALSKSLYRPKCQCSVDAMSDARRFSIAQIAHKGYPFVVVEIDRAERTGLDTLFAPDTLLYVNAHNRHAAINVHRPSGAHLDTGRASAVHADNRDVQSPVHEAYQADPRKMWRECTTFTCAYS